MHEYTDVLVDVRTGRFRSLQRCPRLPADDTEGQHLSPGGGMTPFTRKASTALSTHELDRMYAV
jgi:hypothetical protein